MAKNNLSDLNNHLFEMLEKLGDDEEMQDTEKAKMLIAQSKAMCQVSSQILNIARVQVQAIKTAENCGLLDKDMPALIATKDSKAAKEESRKLLEAAR
jgi:ATP-dependent protease HslVU (ClpYQ) ATPase subunit